jgi:uncharacterized repeat protein (TIGR03803 family)
MRKQRFSIAARGIVVILIVMLSVGVVYAARREGVLYSFNSPRVSSTSPVASLIFDAEGNLYGTAAYGGVNACSESVNCGIVFELTPSGTGGWTESVLHTFSNDGQDGYWPYAGLIFDAAGNLYGTTSAGGSANCGTVFELTPEAGGGWQEAVLHSFDGVEECNPDAGLIFDAAGSLYSTTSGGYINCGTVFGMAPKPGGTWEERVLHSFSYDKDGKDGCDPEAGLTMDAASNLYGTTVIGGTHGGGTVFGLKAKATGGWREGVLHSFYSGDGYDPEGANPSGGLIFDSAGNLYGAAYGGGSLGCGTVFVLTPKLGGGWRAGALHTFAFRINGKDGCNPQAGLTFDSAGNLYGTTYAGGSHDYGTVFALKPNAGGGAAEGILHSFNDNNEDGYYPEASVTLDSAGNLYGTTLDGGTYNKGTVFALRP